ncbi:restriction endonuclease subunit S [Vibrio hibernica]|uniref:restriction endonuclease subunit S n=1 Tax=Vibrio hibernica TaxID=2587465 RepID=UPI00187F4BCE|nr:restriction endonuclease subunit S [Vibrio hibernica]
MNFETATLDSLCELVVDCPHSTPKWTDEGIIVLRNQNIKNGVLDLSAPSFTNEEDYLKRIKRAAPKAGDIVFTREAPMGEVCMIPEGLKCCLGQRQVLLRPKSDVNGQYLFWALQSTYVQQQIAWNEGTGSTVSNVRIPVLKALNIPRISNEDMVAKSLSDIASKMALNTQTNQTLEEMAQAIFKSWFVDFDPVKAKMRGEQPEGMDEATASLFPEKLVESELGLIPEGWEVKPLDKVAHFQNGLALQKFRPESEGDDFLPVLKIAQLRQGYCDGKEKARTDIKESCRVYDGDMIFSWSGTLMIDLWTGGNAALNQHLFKVTSEEYNLPLYLYWTKHHLAKFQQIAKDKAVTMGHIKRGHLSESLCVIPPKALREKLDEVLLPLINQGLNLRLQSNQLATLRDTLLPKLLSGEIELGEHGN